MSAGSLANGLFMLYSDILHSSWYYFNQNDVMRFFRDELISGPPWMSRCIVIVVRLTDVRSQNCKAVRISLSAVGAPGSLLANSFKVGLCIRKNLQMFRYRLNEYGTYICWCYMWVSLVRISSKWKCISWKFYALSTYTICKVLWDTVFNGSDLCWFVFC